MPKYLPAVLVAIALATFPAMANAEAFLCRLNEVAVWPTRIHIRCVDSPTSAAGVIFFAVPTSSSDNASRFLQVALAALKSPDANLLVIFDAPDHSGDSFGCAYVNCRYASAILIQPPPVLP